MELLYIALFHGVLLGETVHARRCADFNPIPGIVTCLSNITHGINNTNVLAGTDTGTIRTYCDEGLFRTSVECLETLYRIKDECPSAEPGLRLPMRKGMPAILNRNVQKLCSSLPEHEKYSKCIVGQRSLIHACLGKNDIIFQQKQADISMEHPEQSVAYNMCRYYKGIEACTSKYVENRCDKDIGVLLGEFISSVNPLNCSTLTASTTSDATSNSDNLYTFLFMSVFMSMSFEFVRFHR